MCYPIESLVQADEVYLMPSAVKNTLSPEHHIAIAKSLLSKGNKTGVHAAIRSAITLGAQGIDPSILRQTILSQDELLSLNINTYSRNKPMADHVLELAGDDKCSLLDVGGGIGLLAHFLPDLDYLLCDPHYNALELDDVSSLGRRFDFVISVHALEHIPDPEKRLFLSKLIELSSKYIAMIVPVQVPDYDKRAGQELVYKITGASWALEHLNCGLPTIDDILTLGRELGLTVEHHGNSNWLTGLATFFLDYFARASGNPTIISALGDVTRFYNERCNLMSTKEPSGDYYSLFRKSI